MKNLKEKVDVLVLFQGHSHGNFLKDNAEAFEHFHQDCKATFRCVFAIDSNESIHQFLTKHYDEKYVYNSPETNGWGRGILRTIVHSLDYFRRQGIEFTHLITVDSDALVVGPLLDQYVHMAGGDKVCFVGTKWGGVTDLNLCSPANPAPTEEDKRGHITLRRKTGILDDYKWRSLDYLVAGPFMMWTRYVLDFMTKIGLLPGFSFEVYYPNIHCPHDQISSLLLGVEGHRFRDVGPLAMLYCGGIGGFQTWKNGFPVKIVPNYGKIPDFPPGTGVIHPVRSKIYDEAMVRLYFRNQRKKSMD